MIFFSSPIDMSSSAHQHRRRQENWDFFALKNDHTPEKNHHWIFPFSSRIYIFMSESLRLGVSNLCAEMMEAKGKEEKKELKAQHRTKKICCMWHKSTKRMERMETDNSRLSTRLKGSTTRRMRGRKIDFRAPNETSIVFFQHIERDEEGERRKKWQTSDDWLLLLWMRRKKRVDMVDVSTWIVYMVVWRCLHIVHDFISRCSRGDVLKILKSSAIVGPKKKKNTEMSEESWARRDNKIKTHNLNSRKNFIFFIHSHSPRLSL